MYWDAVARFTGELIIHARRCPVAALFIHSIQAVYMSITKIHFWDTTITVNSFRARALEIARLAFISAVILI